MGFRQLLIAWKDRRACPAPSPTAFSLLLTGLVFVVALVLSEPHLDRTATAAEVQRVAVSPAKPQRPVSLRDRLVVGLQARTKPEVEFVEEVALRVRTGELPQRIVDETFFWSRSRAAVVRNSRTRRPIIYFKPAMVARAQRLRVNL